MGTIRLSPSALNLFNECPRCFWLEKVRNIKRPRGIFPSLPGGMDLVIKHYFDTYRIKHEMPPEIAGRVQGKLFDNMELLEKWRSWRTTELCYEDNSVNAVLSGALDDCLIDAGYYIPLDYKTRGSSVKEDPKIYYKTQLECYCLMLEARGFKTRQTAYLVYYWPLEVRERGMVRFEVTPYKIDTDIESAKQTVISAAKTLTSGIPEPGLRCEYCSFASHREKEAGRKESAQFDFFK